MDCLNPFDCGDKSRLYCISSGCPVPPDLEDDIMHARKIGNENFVTFIENRLVSKKEKFFEPIRRNKLQTYSKINVTYKKHSTNSNKLQQSVHQRNIFGQLLCLQSAYSLDLMKIFEYQMTPVPYSLAAPNGWPVKTCKSKLVSCLDPGESPEVWLKCFGKTVCYILDGNANIHAIGNLPNTFGHLAELLFNMLPKVERVDFVTDTYKDDSAKRIERVRRGTSVKILLSGPETLIPSDWYQFLSNDENKTQLMKFILTEWSSPKYYKKLQGRRVFFALCTDCFLLTCNDEGAVNKTLIPSLCCNQEEADTRIILHLEHMKNELRNEIQENNSIVIRSPDTDVFLLLIHFCADNSQKNYFDTGYGNKRKVFPLMML